MRAYKNSFFHFTTSMTQLLIRIAIFQSNNDL